MSTADAVRPRQKPPTMTKAPPAGRKFPCPACGAKLDFDPSSKALKCPYCGHVEQIQHDTDGVEEHDFDAYLKHHAGIDKTAIPGRSEQVRCTGCGAVVLLEDKVATDNCPYCSTHLENKPEVGRGDDPAGVAAAVRRRSAGGPRGVRRVDRRPLVRTERIEASWPTSANSAASTSRSGRTTR